MQAVQNCLSNYDIIMILCHLYGMTLILIVQDGDQLKFSQNPRVRLADWRVEDMLLFPQEVFQEAS